MINKRDQEGYVEIDHSNSPGISAEQAASVGSKVVVPGGTVFKSPTFTCSHCTSIVILNPDRSRGRGYCRSCDHDICDRCSLMMKLGHKCKPWAKVVEDVFNANSKGTILWPEGLQPIPQSPRLL